MRYSHEAQEGQFRTEVKGAYYTPLRLANAMVKLCISKDIHTILEPSCGDGVFLIALNNYRLLKNGLY